MPSGFNNRPPITERVVDNVLSNVSGIFSTRQTAKYLSGARCILKINNAIVGFAFSVSWNIRTEAIEIITIDDPIAHELAPQRISVEGTLGMMHIPGNSVGTNLWQPDILNFLTQQYIKLEVRDSATDNLLFYADKVMVTSRAESINVDALANIQLSWRAVGFRDEREPEAGQPNPIDEKADKDKEELEKQQLEPAAANFNQA